MKGVGEWIRLTWPPLVLNGLVFAALAFSGRAADRALNWRLIREQIDQLARPYAFTPGP